MRWLPYIMQLLLCAVADPIHCSEPHTPRAKIVTDRTLPKLGLLSVSECDADFRCVLENIQHLHEYLLVVGPSKCAVPSSNSSSAYRKTVHDLAESAFTIAAIRDSKAIVLLRS